MVKILEHGCYLMAAKIGLLKELNTSAILILRLNKRFYPKILSLMNINVLPKYFFNGK
jgi:hypothetical protein